MTPLEEILYENSYPIMRVNKLHSEEVCLAAMKEAYELGIIDATSTKAFKEEGDKRFIEGRDNAVDHLITKLEVHQVNENLWIEGVSKESILEAKTHESLQP